MKRVGLAAIMTLLLGHGEAGAQEPAGWAEWARYSRSYELRKPDGVDKVTLFSANETAPQRRRFWIARRETSGPGQRPVVRYADSRRCPGMTTHLSRLAGLPMPMIDAPGVDGEHVPRPRRYMTDGISYELAAGALFGDRLGDIRLKSNIGTPLASWVDGALEGWKDCWRAEMPASG